MYMLNNKKQANEEGFASLIIAITLVIVVSLIVVGFSQLASNEQNQTTNRQLSNQAYYSAEAGVNDASAALNAGYDLQKSTCGPLTTGLSYPGASYLTNNNVDKTPPGGAPGPTQWTCLLIDPAPSTADYGSVGTSTPTVFTFTGVGPDGLTPAPVNSITVSWQDSDANVRSFRSNNGVGSSSFPVAASWNAVGMLRFSLTPISVLAQDVLRSSTYSAYLYPTTFSGSSTSAAYDTSPGSNGAILNGSCSTANTPRFCSATISTAGLGSGPFLVSMRSIYSKTNVSVSINSGANDRISGAQSKVDSTGRAQNVLKRIQVRIPNKNEYAYPGFDVEATGDVCKQITVYPGFASGCGY